MIEIKKDQDIYREGLFARALGRSSDSNPYPGDAKEKALWDMGWRMIDESSEGATAPRAVSPMKLVPDSGTGVAAPIARGRRRQPSPDVLLARLRVIQIVVVIAASALMIGMLWLTAR
jgi:hypothetical protein